MLYGYCPINPLLFGHLEGFVILMLLFQPFNTQNPPTQLMELIIAYNVMHGSVSLSVVESYR